jgi:hypothetical protein
MDAGRDVKTSSGYEMDLHKTGVYDEIFDATTYQQSKLESKSPQTSVFEEDSKEDLEYLPPATPGKNKSKKEEVPEIGDFSNPIVED